MTTFDRWLSVAEACAAVGISLRTARTHAPSGWLDQDHRIPVYRFGPRTYRVPGWALDGRSSYDEEPPNDRTEPATPATDHVES